MNKSNICIPLVIIALLWASSAACTTTINAPPAQPTRPSRAGTGARSGSAPTPVAYQPAAPAAPAPTLDLQPTIQAAILTAIPPTATPAPATPTTDPLAIQAAQATAVALQIRIDQEQARAANQEQLDRLWSGGATIRIAGLAIRWPGVKPLLLLSLAILIMAIISKALGVILDHVHRRSELDYYERMSLLTVTETSAGPVEIHWDDNGAISVTPIHRAMPPSAQWRITGPAGSGLARAAPHAPTNTHPGQRPRQLNPAEAEAARLIRDSMMVAIQENWADTTRLASWHKLSSRYGLNWNSGPWQSVIRSLVQAGVPIISDPSGTRLDSGWTTHTLLSEIESEHGSIQILPPPQAQASTP